MGKSSGSSWDGGKKRGFSNCEGRDVDFIGGEIKEAVTK